MVELRYAKEAGELVAIADAEQVCGDVIAGRAYPARVRAALPDLNSEQYATLQAIAHDMLRELAAKAEPPPLAPPPTGNDNGRADTLESAND